MRTADGYIPCSARGIFRKQDVTPLVGDEVIIRDSVIHVIKPRKNELRRPALANVDQVIITQAAAQPTFLAGLLDLNLLLAEHAQVTPIICINKYDLHRNGPEPWLLYEAAGYPILRVSADENTGLDELRALMYGKISVFAGPSGVGKSSLFNRIIPCAQMETGAISTKGGRGKHTTRHAEILPLGKSPNDGYLADTPGFSRLDTGDILPHQMAALFPEFRPYLGLCRFTDCLHIKEVGCAVKNAVGDTIHPSRHESYTKMARGEFAPKR